MERSPEQKLQTALQTGYTVPLLSLANHLKKLGGVRSHIRTGLEPELPDNCHFTGYFPEFGPVMEKCTRIGRIFSMP
jgi:hypothetical protein